MRALTRPARSSAPRRRGRQFPAPLRRAGCTVPARGTSAGGKGAGLRSGSGRPGSREDRYPRASLQPERAWSVLKRGAPEVGARCGRSWCPGGESFVNTTSPRPSVPQSPFAPFRKGGVLLQTKGLGSASKEHRGLKANPKAVWTAVGGAVWDPCPTTLAAPAHLCLPA